MTPLSIVVPVHNGAGTLERCLLARAVFALQQLFYLCALSSVVGGALLHFWPRERTVAAPAARVGC